MLPCESSGATLPSSPSQDVLDCSAPFAVKAAGHESTHPQDVPEHALPLNPDLGN